MYISVRIYISAIKYCSFWMSLSQSMPLGAKKGERMMNSERDTHLYSCFFTCTNVSFRFFQSKLDKTPLIYIRAIKYNCSFSMLLFQSMALGAKTGQRLINSDRDTHLYTALPSPVQICLRDVFQILSFKIA